MSGIKDGQPGEGDKLTPVPGRYNSGFCLPGSPRRHCITCHVVWIREEADSEVAS